MVAEEKAGNDSAGIWYGVLAYTAWGVLPLSWKLLQAVPALEILAHRILWSFIFLGTILLITRGWQTMIAVLANRKKLVIIFLCGVLISFNWLTFIFAVNSNQVIEVSMGYYINPLVTVLLAVLVLKERLSRWQVISLVLAAVGVLIITLQYGKVPWIALILAGTFALYGLTKKIVGIDPVTGLTLETLIVMPVALIYIVNMEISGVGSLGSVPFHTQLILAGSGIATAMPLLGFARGLHKNNLSMMGFLQYITPTINLLLAISVFKEYFSISHLVSFGFIWVALIIFTLANLGVLRDLKPAKPAKADAIEAAE
jgi:chloramphenicol-sensitive protein RarD